MFSQPNTGKEVQTDNSPSLTAVAIPDTIRILVRIQPTSIPLNFAREFLSKQSVKLRFYLSSLLGESQTRTCGYAFFSPCDKEFGVG